MTISRPSNTVARPVPLRRDSDAGSFQLQVRTIEDLVSAIVEVNQEPDVVVRLIEEDDLAALAGIDAPYDFNFVANTKRKRR